MRVLGVVDGGTVLFFELGELDRNCEVDGGAVPDGIAYVMREGANGEGQLVGSVGVAEEAEDEVARTDVVGKIGEEGVAEGIVAKVLDGAATIGVRVGLLKLSLGKSRILLEQNRADGLLPGKVDQLLVGLDGVGDSRGRSEE